MSSTAGQPRNRIYIRVSQQRKTKPRCPEIRAPKRTQTGSAAAEVRVYTYVCIQTRPVSTNPGCMTEACEYGLTRGTCFVARRLEVVAVAGLLWIYSVVCFFSVWWHFVVFFCSFSFLRTHTAHYKYEQYLGSYTSLPVVGTRITYQAAVDAGNREINTIYILMFY